MKVKTLIKLVNIKEEPIDIYISYSVMVEGEEREYEDKLELDFYYNYKNRDIIDWEYIKAKPNDIVKIIV